MNEVRNLDTASTGPNAARPSGPFPGPAVRTATRAQRIGLLIGLAVVAWLALDLFASVLMPFVAAAGIAYVLHPPTTWLTRLGMPRGLATGLMMLGFVAGVLLFVLLLYPLILAQVSLLIGRVPQYVYLVQAWAQELILSLQERFGNDVVDDKLRDLVGGQAGAVVSFLIRTSASVISGGFALFNVLALLIVTPVVASICFATGRTSCAWSMAGCRTAIPG